MVPHPFHLPICYLFKNLILFWSLFVATGHENSTVIFTDPTSTTESTQRPIISTQTHQNETIKSNQMEESTLANQNDQESTGSNIISDSTQLTTISSQNQLNHTTNDSDVADPTATTTPQQTVTATKRVNFTAIGFNFSYCDQIQPGSIGGYTFQKSNLENQLEIICNEKYDDESRQSAFRTLVALRKRRQRIDFLFAKIISNLCENNETRKEILTAPDHVITPNIRQCYNDLRFCFGLICVEPENDDDVFSYVNFFVHACELAESKPRTWLRKKAVMDMFQTVCTGTKIHAMEVF